MAGFYMLQSMLGGGMQQESHPDTQQAE